MLLRHVACVVVAVSWVQAPQEKECPHCGKKLKEGAKFCGGCGKKLEPAPKQRDEQDPPKEKPKPKGIAGVGLTAEEVNRAIDRGADFLIQKYQKRAIDGGEDLLTALALVHARAFDRDAKLQKAFLKLIREASINHLGTYGVAILAMLLDELEIDNVRLANCAKYLVENQGPKGTWGYGRAVEQLKDVKPRRRRVTVNGGEPIDEPGKPWIEIVREGGPDKGHDGDNSCTQYAVLGLRAAARKGVGIPKEVWDRCYKETLTRVDAKSGGCGYTTGRAYGSMTCAVAATLAICRHYLGGDPAKDEGVAKTVGWMARNFGVDENPVAKEWNGYYLYSLERMGMILGEEFIGDHEWYPLGAKRLVSTQAGDGSWNTKDNEKPVFSTSFALLFLTRATPSLKPEIKRGGSGTLLTVAALPGDLIEIILDASGSMDAKIQGRPKFEIAKEAVESLVNELPDGMWAALRVYGHRKRAIEEDADTDSALEIPLGPLDRDKFLAKVRSLRCRGKTPLTYSLEQCAGDLAKVPPEVPVIVLLLTDGIESTRGAKPDLAARALKKARPNLRLVVVGFDVNNKGEQTHLKAVSDAARGEFIPAPDAETLKQGLARGVRGSTSYVLYDAAGTEIGKGELGDKRTLKEGKYSIGVMFGEKEVRQEFWVNTDATTRVVVDLYAEEK
ncbi:MAG: VWA domain-containing protein [Planctomycetes bacterium]|nr:VWA domain-containing protein [Planctomycetota bacterium]